MCGLQHLMAYHNIALNDSHSVCDIMPALAITSELLAELMAGITHTPKDRFEIVDPLKLVKIARALKEFVAYFGIT